MVEGEGSYNTKKSPGYATVCDGVLLKNRTDKITVQYFNGRFYFGTIYREHMN